NFIEFCKDTGLQSIRLESIDSVKKILEEANKRIQPTGTAYLFTCLPDELFCALRGRLYDSNKNLVMATLVVVGGVASAMGPMVEKSSKGILSYVLKCLSDNKKHMRECTINTLDSWVAAVHLDKMVPYVTAALADTKIGAEGRKDLFDWLTKQISGMSDSSEALHLLKPSTSALPPGHVATTFERLAPSLSKKFAQIVLHFAFSALVVIQDML
ncbi:hypothetical protein IFM89_017082, partial [Coptis chinensis]